MKYGFVQQHRYLYSVEMMCSILKISPSSYYNWQKGRYNKRAERKAELQKEIFSLYFEHDQNYGSPRIAAELKTRGVSVSQRTVALHMQSMGIKSKRKKKFIATTDSKHNYHCFDNVLDRRFSEPPEQGAWVSDITYIATLSGFLYLTVILSS